jgi:hypothetical protein
VFNCRLPSEYQLLFDSLLLAGLTDAEAMGWLDGVRRAGLERRFTVRVDPTAINPDTIFVPEILDEPPEPPCT